MAHDVISILSTGVVAACATFLVGLTSESIKRHKERQCIAASLYTEVIVTAAVIGILDNAESITTSLEKMKSRTTEMPTANLVPIYTPIFDKCVDRIGIFDPQIAHEILTLYFCMKRSSETMISVLSGQDSSIVVRNVKLTNAINTLSYSSQMVYPVIISLTKVKDRKWGIFGLLYKYK